MHLFFGRITQTEKKKIREFFYNKNEEKKLSATFRKLVIKVLDSITLQRLISITMFKKKFSKVSIQDNYSDSNDHDNRCVLNKRKKTKVNVN